MPDYLRIPVLGRYCLVASLFATVAGCTEDMVQWVDGGGEDCCGRIRCRIPCETCSMGNSCIQGTDCSVHLATITVRLIFFYSAMLTAYIRPSAGRGGLVVTCLTAVWEETGSNLTMGSRVYHDSHCYTQPWAEATHPYCSAYVKSAFYRLWNGKISYQLLGWVVIIMGDGGCLLQ